MPYTKSKTYRKRRPYRRRKFTSTRTIARQEAKRAINRTIETKSFDSNVQAQGLDYTTGYVGNLLSGITQGVSESQYIGDKITPRGLSIRAQLTRSDSTQLLRIIIIQNKAGGTPLLSTLLQSVGNIRAPLSPLDIDYNHTYRVLYDTCISMDSIRGTTRQLKIHIPWKKFRSVVFNDAVGTYEAGGIYLCAISDSSAVAHPTIEYYSRIWYKDA